MLNSITFCAVEVPFSGDFSIGATVFSHNLHLLSLLSLSIDSKNDAPWKECISSFKSCGVVVVRIDSSNFTRGVSLCGSMSHFVMENFKVY